MTTLNFYDVIISERAAQMLVSHAAFLTNVSEQAAESMIEEFEEAAHSLRTLPERCPWLNDGVLPKNKYRFLVFGNKRYLIIFQIVDQTVYIDLVVDCRQNYHWLVR